MAADDVANAHYRAQAALAAQAAAAGQELWTRIDPGAVLESWRPLAEQAATVLTAAQYAAATRAQPYLADLAQSMGAQPAPAGKLDPSAFAGAAADGGDLVSLLMQPAIRALGLMAVGADDQEALRSGLAALVRMMGTETADAGRVATGVAMTADSSFVTYVRVVHGGACARCIILAGREFSWSKGFERHPRCDCQMVPRVYRPGRGYDAPAPLDPDELFARMSVEDQDRIFGKANASAIREGADIIQVVNARRGMTTAGDKQITTEGTTSRGHAGKLLGQLAKMPGDRYRRSQIPRLTPAQIYKEAGGDREEAIRLLKRFGYLDKWSQISRQRAMSGLERQAAAERAARQAEQSRQEAIERARQAIAEVRRKAEEAAQAAARAAAERARRAAEEAARREAEAKAKAEAEARAAAEKAAAEAKAIAVREAAEKARRKAELARKRAERAAKARAARAAAPGMRKALRHRANHEGLAWARKSMPMPDTLTDAERQAIIDYTGDDFELVNNGLRGNLPTDPAARAKYDRIIADADAAFAKAQAPESLIVHRGVGSKFAEALGLDVNKPDSMQSLVGKVLTEPGYMSTSVGAQAAFKRPIYLMIRVPKGYGAMNVMPISQFGESEREVLLRRNSRYVVHAVYKKLTDAYTLRHDWFIEVELVPDDWEKPPGWKPDAYGDAEEGYYME